MTQDTTGAENVRWDLSDLFPDRESLKAALAGAARQARDFGAHYRGRVHRLDAAAMARALTQMEAVYNEAGAALAYAYLWWSTDTADAARGALLQQVRESHAEIARHMLFFDLEWVRVEADAADVLLRAPELAPYRHHLTRERQYRDHVLTEAEEKIVVDMDVTGRSAWVRFFTETIGGLRFNLDGQALSQQRILAKLHEGDRALRRRAALAFTEGLKTKEHALTYVFNVLLGDKSTRDRLRGFPHWIRSRNLANEIQDETAGALIDAVTGRYDLVARFYALKRHLLGYDTLYDYDRYAPLEDAETEYNWDEARALVLASFHQFHPRMGEVAARFFSDRWIDAPPAPGKQGGAYSHATVPTVHPYILLNYAGMARDVQTLAHELGHGVHQYLSRGQGVLQAQTPLVTAETASVFGELLVFQELLRRDQSPRSRLALLMSKVDDTMATVFRQVAMNRFEDGIHSARRESGELSSEQFSALWMDTQQAMFQGSVTLEDHYRQWWSYIPHFLHTPGYVYAYAFGELLVLSLFAQYEANPSDFPREYISLLEAGGSDWPHVLVGRFGIDLNDANFWHQGLAAVERLVARAEALAVRVT